MQKCMAILRPVCMAQTSQHLFVLPISFANQISTPTLGFQETWLLVHDTSTPLIQASKPMGAGRVS